MPTYYQADQFPDLVLANFFLTGREVNCSHRSPGIPLENERPVSPNEQQLKTLLQW